MPLIRRLDHVARGSGIHFGHRALSSSGQIGYKERMLNGGTIQSLRFGKHLHQRYGRGVMGRGVMGKGTALPEADTVPTPYNVQLPGGRMKRSAEMTKERVIAKLQKLTR